MTRKTSAIVLLGILVAASPASSGCGDGSSQASSTTEAAASRGFGIGNPAPDFTLADVSGKQVSLRDFRGKAVLVDFWATWCGPCRRSMPHFQELSQQYKKDLAVLAISIDQDPVKVVPPYVKSAGLTFTILTDPRGLEVAQTWGQVRSIPTTYLVDPDGVVVKMWLGANPKAAYEAEILKVIKKS